jgi:Zn-dependent peptidase ImmA (M78 family)
MPILRTSSTSPQLPSPSEIVETLLLESGAADGLPTSEGRLLDCLQLKQLSFDFMNELDFIPKSQKKAMDLRAALSFNDRLVAVQSGLARPRRRFGILHEIGHFIHPEHVQTLFLDTDRTLSWWEHARIEREANEMAAELLFQGNRFTEEALSAPTSARTVFELAPRYGASYESALRRYTERHVLPCALIVFDRVKQASDEEIEEPEYHVQYTIASKPFRAAYFSGVETEGSTKRSELIESSTVWGIDQITERELEVESSEKGKWTFETEVFSNGYKIFQLIVRPIKRAS